MRDLEGAREGRGGLGVSETSAHESTLGKPVDQAQARFGEAGASSAEMSRDYISFQAIAGADGIAPRPVKTSWSEFPSYLRARNLFGTRVHRLSFLKPGTIFTLGSKPSKDHNDRNLSGSSNTAENELYGVRDGMLHLRSRVEDLGTRGPQFVNLFKNAAIGPEQAVFEEKNGVLMVRNLGRDPVVWILTKKSGEVGKEWIPQPRGKDVVLEDGTILLFGKDPKDSPGEPLDPTSQTVLRVERHRDTAKDPYRWSLVEFTRADPAQFEKIPELGDYLAILIGQSPAWTQWRFRDLFRSMQEVGWSKDQSKALLSAVVANSPEQAELRLVRLPPLLEMARCIGWSPEKLTQVLFEGPMAKRFGIGMLDRLPKFLEDLSGQGFNPDQIASLLERLARFEPRFEGGLEQVPAFIRDWKDSSGPNPRFDELLAFFDRTQMEMSLFRGFLSGVPGGLGFFFRGMLAILPELRERWGLDGKLATRIGLDTFLGLMERTPAELAAPEAWLPQAVDTIPVALEAMFRLNFGLIQARTILQATHREQGTGFARWWQDIYEASRAPNERLRQNLERYFSITEDKKP
ncbi:MAG: hypothetical protein K8R69_07640 [Deltaproteobacteria bacterium]|nr:hypothetical protein [Deltaproteobacteria bacterium]